MSDDKSPILGLFWDRGSAAEGAGDVIAPEDNNRPARYLEHTVANVLLNRLVGDGIINRNPDVPTIDESTARIAVPPEDDPIIGLLYGRGFIMDSTMEQDSTADGGDTTYLVDAALTQADDYWNDAYVLFTSGTNNGQVRQVTDFESATGKAAWSAELPAAVANGDTFTITFFYIQGLTNNSVNYVYGRALGRTARDAVIQWIANTTGTKTAGDIYIGKVWLDASGNVVEVDNDPPDADRNLWTGVGGVHEIVLRGTVLNLPGGGYVDIERSHADLILLGSIELSTTDDDVAATVVNGWDKDSITFRLDNSSSYDVSSVDYTVRRWGRKKVYL